jgi:hypothetical protein
VGEVIQNNKTYIVYDNLRNKFTYAKGLQIKQLKSRLTILTSPNGRLVGSFNNSIIVDLLSDILKIGKEDYKIYNEKVDLIKLICKYESKIDNE